MFENPRTRNSGIPDFRDSGIPGFRNSGEALISENPSLRNLGFSKHVSGSYATFGKCRVTLIHILVISRNVYVSIVNFMLNLENPLVDVRLVKTRLALECV